MKKISIRVISLMLLVAVFSVACKKNNIDDGFGRQGTLEMKVDGVQWKANQSYVLTTHGGEEDEDEMYAVAISGFRYNGTGIGSSNEDEGESIIIWFGLPASKFNNPVGTYDVVALGDSENDSMVYVQYYENLGLSNQKLYSTVGSSGNVGRVTITGFEIGQQSFLGQVMGGRGYTRLKGNFQLNLAEIKSDGSGIGPHISVTDGKFDVGNQLAF